MEVGPRDGLQSLSQVYPVEVKVELIALLARAGLPKIEITSFVRPDVVPQLADAEDLVALLPRVPGCAYAHSSRTAAAPTVQPPPASTRCSR